MKKLEAEKRERIKYLEIQHEIVKKFSSSQEFIEFLKTDRAKQAFASGDRTEPRRQILRHLSAGTLFLLAGISLLIQGYSWRDYTDINFVNKAHDLYFWGGLAVAAGTGLMINALIGVLLGRKWHLFKDLE
jgi:hypothetical protein